MTATLQPELRLAFADAAALACEYEHNLKHGRAFAPGDFSVEALEDCVLVLVHPASGRELALACQAVLVNHAENGGGVGVQLRPFNASVLALLSGFVQPEPAPGFVSQAPAPADTTVAAMATQEGASDPDDSEDLMDGDVAVLEQQHPARHEVLRKISQTEQQKIARMGELNDRVILERLYGKAVWEGLLHNPRVSPPEVARIARNGTVPRPLLEFILEQGGWIQSPIVRRALLGNPRISGEGIMKLLRITPKHELRSIHKTATYSSQVRELARKALDLG